MNIKQPNQQTKGLLKLLCSPALSSLRVLLASDCDGLKPSLELNNLLFDAARCPLLEEVNITHTPFARTFRTLPQRQSSFITSKEQPRFPFRVNLHTRCRLPRKLRTFSSECKAPIHTSLESYVLNAPSQSHIRVEVKHIAFIKKNNIQVFFFCCSLPHKHSSFRSTRRPCPNSVFSRLRTLLRMANPRPPSIIAKLLKFRSSCSIASTTAIIDALSSWSWRIRPDFTPIDTRGFRFGMACGSGSFLFFFFNSLFVCFFFLLIHSPLLRFSSRQISLVFTTLNEMRVLNLGNTEFLLPDETLLEIFETHFSLFFENNFANLKRKRKKKSINKYKF